MNLLEVDGKALVSAHGVRIPQGALWPALPDCAGPLVVKAQVPEGRRGKRGGIEFVDSGEAVPAAVESLLGRKLGEYRVDSVYIEQQLAIARECYLAVSIDRDRQCRVVVASAHGGMEIESVPEQSILKLAVDPLLGWRRFHGEQVARFLGAAGEIHEALCDCAEALYRMAESEDAELVELNPLAVTEDNRVVACDAKVILDDNARFRHPEWAHLATRPARSPLEDAIAATGAIGIELDPQGDVIGVVSGAGLMMATLDLLADAGYSVRCMVDLGGTVLAGGDELKRVFDTVAAAATGTLFINAFLQMAPTDAFAERLAEAYAGNPFRGEIVVRLKGHRSEAGRERLHALGFDVHEELDSAIAAIASSGGAG